MTSRVPFYFLISMLVIVGITLSIMRHQDYGVPWTPGESRQVWDVEARIEPIWQAVDYDIDGVILETTHPDIKAHLGATRHHHRWQTFVTGRDTNDGFPTWQ